MSELADLDYLKQAIQQAKTGKTPFGCVIAKDGKVVSQAFNTVVASHDPTAHAEINAIRKACQQLHTHQLEKMVLYTTGEPCPMCMSSILYARIQRVVYGVSIATIAQFMPQIMLPSEEVIAKSVKKTVVEGPFLEAECVELFKLFS